MFNLFLATPQIAALCFQLFYPEKRGCTAKRVIRDVAQKTEPKSGTNKNAAEINRAKQIRLI